MSNDRHVDDWRYLNTERLEREEIHEIEGAIRARDHQLADLQETVVSLRSEREALKQQVDDIRSQLDEARGRLDQLTDERPTIEPNRIVSLFGEAIGDLQDELREEAYTVSDLNVDLQANVVYTDEGIRLHLPGLAEEFATENLSRLSFGIQASPPTEDLMYESVPDVRGMALESAEEVIGRRGFSLGEVSYMEADEANVVAEQYPSAEAVARPGIEIDLIVTELPSTEMPTLVGHSLDEATTILNEHDLRVGHVTTEHNDAPPNTVIDQDPVAGNPVEAESEVELVVSMGTTDEPSEGTEQQPVPETESEPVEKERDLGDQEPEEPAIEESRTEQAELGVEHVSGIGPTYGGRLRSSGVATVSDMVERSSDELAEIAGVSPSRSRRWIDQAQELMEG